MKPTVPSLARKFSRGAPIPMDLSQLGPFNFPHTRKTILDLEEKRLFLHYLRLEKTQFGQLYALRKKFTPISTSATPIKVRHQHYLGESHPASSRVSITFPLSSLPLTAPQQHKFKLLAGPRFDPTTGEVKISSDRFERGEMNEKWCSDVLDKLVEEAQNGQDGFQDLQIEAVRGNGGKKGRKGKKVVTLKDFPEEWLAATRPAPST